MEPFEVKLSVQLAMRLAALEASIKVANTVMSEVMTAYKKVCDAEQQRMDVLMSSIAEANDKELPPGYEYAFDSSRITITFRKPDPPQFQVGNPASIINGSR